MPELARCPSLISGLCGPLTLGGEKLVAQMLGGEGLVVVVLGDPVESCRAGYSSLEVPSWPWLRTPSTPCEPTADGGIVQSRLKNDRQTASTSCEP